MTLTTTEQSGQVAPLPTPVPAPARRRRFPRGLVWLVGAVVVIGLVVLTVGLLSAAATNNRTDDPRSVTPGGTAALAQLLSDEGVRVIPVDSADRAAELARPGTTLVVANAARLDPEQVRRLLAGRPSQVILLSPGSRALETFGLAAETTSSSGGDVRAPACDAPAAGRSGPILLESGRGYRSTGTGAPTLACYRTGQGWIWLRPGGTGGSGVPVDIPIDIVAGGVSNDDIGEQGNAAFGMNAFGSQPTLVWLMAERRDSGGGTPALERPTLLPSWWAIGVVQAVVALVVIGIWRGRRLGPIMVEPLPVRVRSSETVIGHGRLYFRIGARDRAAESLRAGVRERLGRRFGHRFDPDALVATLADQTRRPGQQVWQLLYGPPPDTDDALVALARALDELETVLNGRAPRSAS